MVYDTFLLFSLSVMSNSLWPHGLHYTRLPCPSPSPRDCSNSCPLSGWCHSTVSSSVIPFSYLHSFPASVSFLISWLFTSGEGNDNPLQYPCLENPVDGGVWQAKDHRVAKSWSWLSDFTHSLTRIRWPKYWSFGFSINPSNEYSGLNSIRIDWFDLFAVQGTLKSLLQHRRSKEWILCLAFFMVQFSHPYRTTRKTIALTKQILLGK